MGPYYQAFPEGGSLTIYEDDARPAPTSRSPSSPRRTPTPGRSGTTGSGGIADVMGPLLTQVPPNIGSHAPSDLLDLAKLAWSQNRGIDRPHDRRHHPAADA